jgi:hypothetical protein
MKRRQAWKTLLTFRLLGVIGIGLLLGGCCHTRKLWEQAVLRQAITDMKGGVTQFRWDYRFDDDPGERFWDRTDPGTWREIYASGQCKTFRVLTNKIWVTIPWDGAMPRFEGQIVEMAAMNGLPEQRLSGAGLQVLVPLSPSQFPRLMMRNGSAGSWEYLGEIRDWRTAVGQAKLR